MSTKQESRKQKNHGKQKSHGKQDGRQQHRKQKQNRDGERLVGIAPVGFQKGLCPAPHKTDISPTVEAPDLILVLL